MKWQYIEEKLENHGGVVPGLGTCRLGNVLCCRGDYVTKKPFTICSQDLGLYNITHPPMGISKTLLPKWDPYFKQAVTLRFNSTVE